MADKQPTEDGADVRDCFRCGATMEQRTEQKPFGGFGSTGQVAASSAGYFVCPNCGHDTRYPNR